MLLFLGIEFVILLAAWFVLVLRFEEMAKPPDREVKKLSTVEEFEAQCEEAQLDFRKREICLESLPVLQNSLVWIDSRLLLHEREELAPQHLDRLFSFSQSDPEAARLAVTGVLASWCQWADAQPVYDFAELKRMGCTEYLPTLGELGFEVDPSLAGIKVVESDYKGSRGSTRVVWSDGR